jgi:hypothetical protein
VSLDSRDIGVYQFMVFAFPVAIGILVLTAVITGVEWVSNRATGKQLDFRGLRSIAGEVLKHVVGGAIIGGCVSILGVLPGLGVAWLVLRDVSMSMFRIAAPVATLIGILTLFCLRGHRIIHFFFSTRLALRDDRKSLVWGTTGWLLGAFCPAIGFTVLLRYPHGF